MRDSYIDGVLVRVESISNDDDSRVTEFVVVLEDENIELRQDDRKKTIWWMPLAKLEEAVRQLKRAQARERKARDDV
jgi:hypothetical protein